MVLIRPQGINQPGQMTYTQPSLFNIVSELLQSMGEAVGSGESGIPVDDAFHTLTIAHRDTAVDSRGFQGE